MDNKEKILPCPWCDGEAEIVQYDGIGAPCFYVECVKETCRGCGMPFQKFVRRKDAREDWNTRATPTVAPEEKERDESDYDEDPASVI